MNRQAMLIVGVGLLAALSGPLRVDAQERRQTLGPSQEYGSEPYREAVRRFLAREEPKIVGGRPAPEGAFPWQVSLSVSWIVDPYRAHFCGATIVSPTWLVTAAHCVEGLTPRDVSITAGTNWLGIGGIKVNVRRIIVHPEYVAAVSGRDIAIVETFDPLPLGEWIAAVPLNQDDENPAPGIGLVAVGWGATVQGGSTVRDLRFVEVPAVSSADCNRPLAYDGRIMPDMLCAGVMSGGMDACQGDSGGPLTVDTGSHPVLAGVVSWGDGCALPNRVGIYTRVSVFAGWIRQCLADPEACAT